MNYEVILRNILKNPSNREIIIEILDKDYGWKYTKISSR